MSTKIVSVDYGKVSADTSSPKVSATTPVSNINTGTVGIQPFIATYQPDQVAINSQFVNIQPVPGLYKRGDSLAQAVSSIVKQPNKITISQQATSFTIKKDTQLLKTFTAPASSTIFKTINPVYTSTQNAGQLIYKGANLYYISTQGASSIKTIEQGKNYTSPPIIGLSSISKFDVQKSLLSIVYSTDDSLGQAVADDDQTAWVDKNLIHTANIIQSVFNLVNKPFSSQQVANSIIVRQAEPVYTSTQNTAFSFQIQKETNYIYTQQSLASSTYYFTNVFFRTFTPQVLAQSSKSIEQSKVYSSTANAGFQLIKSAEPVDLSTVSLSFNLSKSAEPFKLSTQSTLTAVVSKHSDKAYTSGTSLAEEKTAVAHNYFAGNTYTADITYAGTLYSI